MVTVLPAMLQAVEAVENVIALPDPPPVAPTVKGAATADRSAMVPNEVLSNAQLRDAGCSRVSRSPGQYPDAASQASWLEWMWPWRRIRRSTTSTSRR